MEEIRLRKYRTSDEEAIKDIFNYFGKESFACYNESDITITDVKDRLNGVRSALVYEENEKVIGFGYISRYKEYPNFDHTGVLTYFLLPDYTGRGLGTKLINQLFSIGKSMGISNYLAHISSENKQSLNFHKKLGFEKVGKMKNVARKFGKFVNIIWVQKEFGNKGGINE